jgi:hypothetical protein
MTKRKHGCNNVLHPKKRHRDKKKRSDVATFCHSAVKQSFTVVMDYISSEGLHVDDIPDIGLQAGALQELWFTSKADVPSVAVPVENSVERKRRKTENIEKKLYLNENNEGVEILFAAKDPVRFARFLETFLQGRSCKLYDSVLSYIALLMDKYQKKIDEMEPLIRADAILAKQYDDTLVLVKATAARSDLLHSENSKLKARILEVSSRNEERFDDLLRKYKQRGDFMDEMVRCKMDQLV